MKAWGVLVALILMASGLTAGQSRGATCAGAAQSPPSQPLAARDFVELERTSCYGLCPVYTVRIQADGQITWTGRDFVQVKGNQTAAIPVELARTVIEKFRADTFWSLCAGYPVGTDAPQYIVTVRVGGQEKRVSTGPPPSPLLPGNPSVAVLPDLEREIDETADTHRWIHGDPQKELFSAGVVRSDGAGGKPGVTPLMRAASMADNSRIQELLAAKADPNARDVSGWTALVYAASSLKARLGSSRMDPSEIAAVRMLLDAGARPDTQSFMGQTPLMAAVQTSSSSLEKARLLIAAGADVNAQDKSGQTVLMHVIRGSLMIRPEGIQNDQVELCALLRAAGARTDLRDSGGLTVFDLLEKEMKPWTQTPRPGTQEMETKHARLRQELQKQ